MAIAVECGQCGRLLSVREELAGKRVKCPCGEVLQAPDGPPAPQKRVPAAPAPRGIEPKIAAETPSFSFTPAPSKPAAASDVQSLTALPTITISDKRSQPKLPAVKAGEAEKRQPADRKAGSRASASAVQPESSATTTASPRLRQLRKRGVPLAMMVGAAALLVLLAGIGLIALIASTFSGGDASYDSPGAAYAAFVQAQNTGEWNASYDLMTPQSQRAAAGSLACFAVMLSPADDDIAAVLGQHGIDPRQYALRGGNDLGAKLHDFEAARHELLGAIADRRAFYSDIMPLVRRSWPRMERMAGVYGVNLAAISPQGGADLRNVTINGNAAWATVHVKSLPLVQHFAFIDGSWRVDLTRQFHAD